MNRKGAERPLFHAYHCRGTASSIALKVRSDASRQHLFHNPRRPFAGSLVTDLHEGVEPTESFNLPLPFRRVAEQRQERLSQLLRRAIPLNELRDDVLTEH